jgi:hypothetical protein
MRAASPQFELLASDPNTYATFHISVLELSLLQPRRHYINDALR